MSHRCSEALFSAAQIRCAPVFKGRETVEMQDLMAKKRLVFVYGLNILAAFAVVMLHVSLDVFAPQGGRGSKVVHLVLFASGLHLCSACLFCGERDEPSGLSIQIRHQNVLHQAR